MIITLTIISPLVKFNILIIILIFLIPIIMIHIFGVIEVY